MLCRVHWLHGWTEVEKMTYYRMQNGRAENWKSWTIYCRHWSSILSLLMEIDIKKLFTYSLTLRPITLSSILKFVAFSFHKISLQLSYILTSGSMSTFNEMQNGSYIVCHLMHQLWVRITTVHSPLFAFWFHIYS